MYDTSALWHFGKLKSRSLTERAKYKQDFITLKMNERSRKINFNPVTSQKLFYPWLKFNSIYKNSHPKKKGLELASECGYSFILFFFT